MPDERHFTTYDTRLAAYALVLDDNGRILLSWYNGSNATRPGWTLPGGGVDYDEQLEEGVVREVREETGYDVVVGRPLMTHSITGEVGRTTGRPYKSTRVVFDATVVGGELGTLEVGGTTDFARWLTLDELGDQYRSGIVDLAVSAHRSWSAAGRPDR